MKNLPNIFISSRNKNDIFISPRNNENSITIPKDNNLYTTNKHFKHYEEKDIHLFKKNNLRGTQMIDGTQSYDRNYN